MAERRLGERFSDMKQGKMFWQMVLSYFMVSTLLILVLSFMLTKRFTEKSKQDYIDAYAETLGRVSSSANLIFSGIYKNTQEMAENDDTIRDAIYGTSFRADDIIEIRDRMTDFLVRNSFVESIYLVNGAADTVFTSYPYQSRKDEFYDREALELLEGQESRKICARNGLLSVNGEELKMDCVTLLYPVPDRESSGQSGIVINISSRILAAYLGSPWVDNTDIFILDAENEVIFSSGSGGLLDYVEEMTQEAGKDREENHFFYRCGDEAYEVVYRKSGDFGFTCLGAIPETRIRDNSSFMLRWILILTMLLIVTGLLIACHYVLKIYTPVYSLVEKVRGKEEKDGGEASEFEYLDKAYDQLFCDVGNLSGQMEQYCLYRILDGEYASPEQMYRDMESCGLAFPYPSYQVFCVRFRHYKEGNASYGQSGMLQFKTEVMQMCEKIFGDAAECRTVSLGEDSIALVVGAEDFSEEKRKEYQRILGEFMRLIKKKYGLWLTAGAGLLGKSVEDLGESSRQAVFAVSCGMYQSAEQSALQEVLDYRDVRGMEESSMEYPMEAEKKILSALRAMNEEEAAESCSLFMSRLMWGNPEIAQLYILKFCVPLSELFAGEGMQNLDFYHIKRELENRETLYEKQEYLNTLFSDFVSRKLEQKRRKERDAVENVMAWIRENYRDGNMTLDTISEAQGCSSSYLRRIFREAKQTSPTDYLMEVRMDKARELLLSTEDTSVSICEQIGITNTKYFYSVFKKATGYTTSEYRKQFGGKKRENEKNE